MWDIAKDAEEKIKEIRKKDPQHKLSTSQIRKFLTAVNAVKNKIEVYKAQNLQKSSLSNGIILSDELVNEVKFLKVKVAYQAGRDEGYTYRDNDGKKDNKEYPVKDFFKITEMMDKIDQVGVSSKNFDDFAHYVEALVAYHKYNGGK